MEKKSTKLNKSKIIRPIVITERDKCLMVKIANYRALTTEQISRLCFPSLSRTRKRLFQLWRNGYLRRLTKPVRMGNGSSMFIYRPSRRGLSLIADISPERSKLMKNMHSTASFGDHMLAVNEFRMCMELASKHSNDLALLTWREGKGLLMTTHSPIKPVSVIPDAYFVLKRDGKLFHYFLELDRGTADLNRVTHKCQTYLHIWKEKIAHNKFGLNTFRVLFVTSGQQRAVGIIGQLNKLRQKYARTDVILTAPSTAYSAVNARTILDSIWKTIDSSGVIRETVLLPPPSLQSSRQREENHHCAVQNPIPVNGHPGPGG